jgi:hypothetical protein
MLHALKLYHKIQNRAAETRRGDRQCFKGLLRDGIIQGCLLLLLTFSIVQPSERCLVYVTFMIWME